MRRNIQVINTIGYLEVSSNITRQFNRNNQLSGRIVICQCDTNCATTRNCLSNLSTRNKVDCSNSSCKSQTLIDVVSR